MFDRFALRLHPALQFLVHFGTFFSKSSFFNFDFLQKLILSAFYSHLLCTIFVPHDLY